MQLGHDGVRAGAAQLLGRGQPAGDRDHEVDAGAAAGRDALGRGGDGDDPVGATPSPSIAAVERRRAQLEVLVEPGQRERGLAARAAVDERDPLALARAGARSTATLPLSARMSP